MLVATLGASLVVAAETGPIPSDTGVDDAEARTDLGTSFGAILTPANHPDQSAEDFVDAMRKLADLGDHVSYIANWSGGDCNPAILSAIKEAATLLGLRTVFQLSPAAVSLPAPPDGLPASFADAAVRDRYLADVEIIAATAPDYLVLATEINLLAYLTPDAFDDFIPLYQAAYARVKEISPDTQVGVSYQLSTFFGAAQFDLPERLGPRDFYGISSYPSWTVYEGHYASVDDIPSAYFGRLKAALPDAPILFAEIGWTTGGKGNEIDQDAFVRRLPELLRDTEPVLVSWAQLHDVGFFTVDVMPEHLADTLAGLGVDAVELFAELNAVGLFYRDGLPKPAWATAKALEFDAPDSP